MNILDNPYTGSGLPEDNMVSLPSVDVRKPAALLGVCPAYKPTPLVNANQLAKICGVGSIFIKDERSRFDLGSFKALGAAYVIAGDAAAISAKPSNSTLIGATYVAASAGNHGLSVAAGAAVFGASAVIYLSNNVPESFAERLREKQAIVVRKGNTYEECMQAAMDAAKKNGWQLLSDSSWTGYHEVPHRLMEGYLQIGSEVVEQLECVPDHIILQAGVGGFAGSIAALARHVWGDTPRITVVEPAAAPALYESIRSGKFTVTSGPVSSMGRLDCKEPSLIALKGLARDANQFVTIDDEEVQAILPVLGELGLATSPSGAAGIAPLFTEEADRRELQLTPQSSVLVFITEEAER